MANDILPYPDSDSQDSDSAIVAMIAQMLADDNLFVQPYNDSLFELFEQTADGSKTIDIYETRAAAYRGAIDCLIEACIDAWDKGGEK